MRSLSVSAAQILVKTCVLSIKWPFFRKIFYSPCLVDTYLWPNGMGMCCNLSASLWAGWICLRAVQLCLYGYLSWCWAIYFSNHHEILYCFSWPSCIILQVVVCFQANTTLQHSLYVIFFLVSISCAKSKVFSNSGWWCPLRDELLTFYRVRRLIFVWYLSVICWISDF